MPRKVRMREQREGGRERESDTKEGALSRGWRRRTAKVLKSTPPRIATVSKN